MSMAGDFRHRAEEYVRLAQRAGTIHDRELFLDMAMAWLGLADKPRGGAAVLPSVPPAAKPPAPPPPGRAAPATGLQPIKLNRPPVRTSAGALSAAAR